jgi:Putative DNA-binding domain
MANHLHGQLNQLSRQKGIHLRFLDQTRRSSSILSKTDKRNLAKTISAFSNSGDGILIFGVKTKKSNDIDVVADLLPIQDIEKLRDKVKFSIGDLTRPVNQQIEIDIIRCEEEKNRGYLVIYVPFGADRPVMSMAPDQSQYFRRSATSTRVMDHYEIRDMFLATTNARFSLRCEASPSERNGGGAVRNFAGRFRFIVKNISNVAARTPYLILSPKFHSNMHVTAGALRMKPDGRYGVYTNSGFIIHSDDELEICTIDFYFKLFCQSLKEEKGEIEDTKFYSFGLKRDGSEILDYFEDIAFEFTTGAENAIRESHELRLSKLDIVSSMLKNNGLFVKDGLLG